MNTSTERQEQLSLSMEQNHLTLVSGDTLQQSRFWIGVVSQSHVRIGVEEGVAQLCHGKEAALKRMRAGDWLIYYSPRTERNGGEPLQAFTAIGQVSDDLIYPFHMSDTFVPFRRAVRFLPCETVKIAGLLDELSFTSGKRSWGYSFRFGQIKISREDFLIIAAKMLGETWSQSLRLEHCPAKDA